MSLRSIGCVLAFLVPAGSSGCDRDDADGVSTLAGRGGDELHVAIVADDRHMVLYACDGTADTVSITEWFEGTHEHGRFDLASPRTTARVEGTLDERTGEGTLHVGGVAHEFHVQAGEGDGGLYFDEVTEADVVHWGGWIVLDDGRVRGSVLNRKTGGIIAAGEATPQSSVTVGSLTFQVLRLEAPVL
jgi:hypothetical protein